MLNNGDIVGLEQDKAQFVEFFTEAVHHKFKSEEEGHPVYVDKPFVKIMTAGSRDEVIRPIKDSDKQRWPREWEFYEKNEEIAVEGWPIEQWPALSKSQIAELKHMNIPTVEALAALSDTGIQNVGMGARELVAKAKAALEAANGNAGLEKLAAENERQKDEIEILKSQVAELAAKVEKKGKKKAA